MPAKIFDLFDALPLPAQQAFTSEAIVRHFQPQEIIYCQGDSGDSMFRVLRGDIRLSAVRSDGRELYYVDMGPGDCFGEGNHVDGLLRPQTAVATTEVDLQVLAGAAIERLTQAHPALTFAVMKLLCNHMRLLIDLVADASLNDLPERIARRIIGALPPSITDYPPNDKLPIKLSQSDLAHMVGASRQSVNRVLQRFQKERLITTEYGRVVIQSLARLKQRAECGGLSKV